MVNKACRVTAWMFLFDTLLLLNNGGFFCLLHIHTAMTHSRHV